jgi:regulatory protein
MMVTDTLPNKIAAMDSYLISAIQVVFRKIKDYCRYQPRTHQQVRRKLYAWKLAKNTVETLLAALIEERLVNESHYATTYAGERFRINGWGKNKVRVELRKRQISPYCIREALAAVDAVQYEKELMRLADKKWSSFQGKGLHPFRRAKKTADFLIRKGYEPNTVWNLVRELQNTETHSDDG